MEHITSYAKITFISFLVECSSPSETVRIHHMAVGGSLPTSALYYSF